MLIEHEWSILSVASMFKHQELELCSRNHYQHKGQVATYKASVYIIVACLHQHAFLASRVFCSLFPLLSYIARYNQKIHISPSGFLPSDPH